MDAAHYCATLRLAPHALPSCNAARASPAAHILSNRLKQLEKEGIVRRRKSTSGRSWTYHLTQAGEELAAIVLSLGVWGQKWSRRNLAKYEIDLGLLLWAMERGAKPEAFGRGRTVVQLKTHRPGSRKNATGGS